MSSQIRTHARNSVPNDNRNVNIDLPRQEEKLLRSTNDYNNRQNLSKVAVGNATVKKSSVAITNGRTPITAAMTESLT